jgi:hypothetical protein
LTFFIAGGSGIKPYQRFHLEGTPQHPGNSAWVDESGFAITPSTAADALLGFPDHPNLMVESELACVFLDPIQVVKRLVRACTRSPLGSSIEPLGDDPARL